MISRTQAVKRKAPEKARIEVPIEGYIFTSNQISVCFSLALVAALGNGLWHYESTPFATLCAYFLVVVAWAIPTALWCFGRTHGMPLYPVFCTVNLIAFGLPLLTNHPWVVMYSPEDHLSASLIVSLTLLAGAIPWFSMNRNHGHAPAVCLQMDDKGGETLLITAMGMSALFHFLAMINLLEVSGGVLGLIRGFADGLGMLGIFVLAQRMGSGRLQRQYVGMYVLFLAANASIQLTSLLLVNVFSIIILATAGYFLGSRKVPWLILGGFTLILSVLHGGKGAIRDYYWADGQRVVIKNFDEFLGLYSRWIDYSMKNFNRPDIPGDESTTSSLLERTSLIHLLLYMQNMNQHGHAYLGGESYTIIPSLLMPRVLDPNKPWSHEGTYRLNIHYGLQSREDTMTTTIGFGLINEGYGNFGFIGSILVGLVMGCLLGAVTRWAWGMPVLSFRSLFSVLVLGACFQTEFSSGVFITTIFQGTMALSVFSFFFMKQRPHSGILDWLKVNKAAEARPATP